MVLKNFSLSVLCCVLLSVWVSCSSENKTKEPVVDAGAEQATGKDAGGSDFAQAEHTIDRAAPTDHAQQEQPKPDTVSIDSSQQDVGHELVQDRNTSEPAPDVAVEKAPEQSGRKDQVITGGPVSGDWCGKIEVKAGVQVEVGKVLRICAGSQVLLGDGVDILVRGTLNINGTQAAPVLMKPSATQWRGLRIEGTLSAVHVELHKGLLCLDGRDKSALKLDHALLLDCGTAARLRNGASFVKSLIVKGASLSLLGGMLRMTDSIIDLKHNKQSPDCTSLQKGGVILNRVRFTGCHCPLHFLGADLKVEVSNSIFDGAAYPMMISNVTATFTHNHFLGGTAHIYDIGDGKGVTANIAGNYFDGGAPKMLTNNAKQFTGTSSFSKTPFTDVGPR